jgi:hypothetical protein
MVKMATIIMAQKEAPMAPMHWSLPLNGKINAAAPDDNVDIHTFCPSNGKSHEGQDLRQNRISHDL